MHNMTTMKLAIYHVTGNTAGLLQPTKDGTDRWVGLDLLLNSPSIMIVHSITQTFGDICEQKLTIKSCKLYSYKRLHAKKHTLTN